MSPHLTAPESRGAMDGSAAMMHPSSQNDSVFGIADQKDHIPADYSTPTQQVELKF